MAGEAYSRDGTLSGMATGLTDLDRLMGGLQKSDLIIIAGRPGMAKTSLATNIAFHVAQKLEGRGHARRPPQDRRRRPGRLLLARNERRAARDAYPRRAGRDLVLRHPARQHPREPVRQAGRCLERDVGDPALYRRHRRPLDQRSSRRAPGGSSGRRGSTSSSSTTCSCSRARRARPTRTACRS